MPRWMLMTKLLPIIPAFGVCFAGGMLLRPAALDRSQGLRVLSQVEPVGDNGYAVWKAAAEQADIAPVKPPGQADEATELAAKAERIRASIAEIDSWLRDNEPRLKEREEDVKWVEMVRQDASYKKLCETKQQLDQLITEKVLLKDMAWKDRKEWRARYEEALNEHQEAMRQNLAKLQDLRAKDPRGAGK